MNVLCKSKEIQSYVKDLEIEVEGEIYRATLTYDSECGYELAFYGSDDKGIDWPEWADKYDNGQRSLKRARELTGQNGQISTITGNAH
jgi:hypothetical protein